MPSELSVMPYFQPNDGVDLFYVDERPTAGALTTQDRAPCLLIHGWTCDALDWLFQIPLLLARGHRVLAFDARGHGKSSVPSELSPEQLRPEVTADDAASLLKAILSDSETPCIVFGHSSGGLIASLFTTRHPELAKALVLVDPIYYSSREECVHFNQLLATQPYDFTLEVLSRLSYTSKTPDWLKMWHRIRVFGTPAWVIKEHAYQKELINEASGNWEGAQQEFGGGKRKVPRLAIFSFALNMDKERSLGVKDGDCIDLLEEGHWMHVQAHDKFFEMVQSWLTRISL